MKYAISTDNGSVSQHFGRCPQFTILDINEGKVTGKKMVSNPGHEPGFLPKFLGGQGVNVMVAGGMGPSAVSLFQPQNIEVILGVSGSIDEVIEEITKGSLKGGDSTCNPGGGKGYGLDKTVCDHGNEK
ncbi:MAG: NifB/NifX family molybdenum-iron cluster-binding protein [Candidatus Goldbacteria bacterium]|nr:NifB/NifX family molybdenum-iron cluster-binding protein [Candidatus Goldiibacteriota bacterium]